MADAYCDCTGSPPCPPMIRIHAGGPNRYYLCRECGAVREDIYQDGAIIEHRWHDSPNGTLPKSVREEARELLEAPVGEQLTLWSEDDGDRSQGAAERERRGFTRR